MRHRHIELGHSVSFRFIEPGEFTVTGQLLAAYCQTSIGFFIVGTVLSCQSGRPAQTRSASTLNFSFGAGNRVRGIKAPLDRLRPARNSNSLPESHPTQTSSQCTPP